MSYSKGPKRKKKIQYRFEGVDITKLPSDIEWLKIASNPKVASAAIDKYPYWFVRGTRDHLRKTKIAGEAN